MSKGNIYLGTRHSKEKCQDVIISKERSSLGFYNRPNDKGFWELQLNFHCIASEKLIIGIKVEVA